MDAENQSGPGSPLLEGLAAGFGLGLSDWAASGFDRTPLFLAAADVLACVLAGAAAGGLAQVSGRRGLAAGLVLAGGIALEGLSIASKELTGTSQVLAATLVLAFALLALIVCARRGRAAGARSSLASAGLLASLPMGMLVAAVLARAPLAHLAGLLAPGAWIAGEGALSRWAHAPRRGWLLAAALLLLAPLPLARLGRRELARPALAPPTEAGASSGPSIVLLVIDTLRADAPAPGGALSEFARGGVEFRACVSAAPWTLPALSSLFTSLYPSQHGALTAATPLAEDVTTLAEFLRGQGYATAGFTGGAFVGAGHHLDQGFEVFDSTAERRFPAFGAHLPLLWRVAKNRYLPWRWLVAQVDEYRGLAGGLAAAREWIARAESRPRFLFLHTYQVHDYYLYDPDEDDGVLATLGPSSARFAGRLSVHPDELQGASQAELDRFHALYRGRVAAVEALLPGLVNELTAQLGPDTIWIVTADHGEGFDAARRRVHHGGRLHDDLLHVPLFVRAPGRLPAGRVVTDTVRSIDVLPTVLELAGVPVPAGLSGESLLPALRGERPFPGVAFAEERAHGYELLAVRCEGWKLTRSPAGTELYHVAEDPLESAPLASEPPAALSELLRSFPERFPARASTEVELDDATLEHLRALGYVR